MNKRFLAVVLAGGLVASAAIAGPATAAKKKKKPKPPKPAVCQPYTPGELGAEKPMVVLTDEATAEKPVEQKVSLGESTADLQVGDSTSDAFNVQVDSANPEIGLYAQITFEPRRDFDIFLRYPDGSEGASSHGWNTIYEDPGDAAGQSFSDTGHGGETTDTSETIHGIKTADCGGWTVEVQNHLAQATDLTVKLWLGEIKNDPLAPGE
jgi:hypothetical protein